MPNGFSVRNIATLTRWIDWVAVAYFSSVDARVDGEPLD